MRHARFSTASVHPAATSFVGTGDTAGQGWGINPDLGGMTTYATMHATRPDFFIPSGDTSYADGPLAETVTETDGQVWRNLVTPAVSKVAESLEEFRGPASLQPDGPPRAVLLRRCAGHLPVGRPRDAQQLVPGQVIDAVRCTERRVDVLASRARRAWQEFQPISTADVRHRGRGGFAEARIYRKIHRGPHLDVLCLDMRTWKRPNTAGTEKSLSRSSAGSRPSGWSVRYAGPGRRGR